MRRVLTMMIGSVALLAIGLLPQGVSARDSNVDPTFDHTFVTCKQIGEGPWLVDHIDPPPIDQIPESCSAALALMNEDTQALIAEAAPQRRCQQLSHTALRADDQRIRWSFFRRRTVTVRRVVHTFVCSARSIF